LINLKIGSATSATGVGQLPPLPPPGYAPASNPFVAADRPMLDNFTVAREYSCYSVCLRRIDQSHAQKASGVTTSIHFVISRVGPGGWGPLL